MVNSSCDNQDLIPEGEIQIENNQNNNKLAKKIITDSSVIEEFKNNIAFLNTKTKQASISSSPNALSNNSNFNTDVVYEVESADNNGVRILFIEGKLNNNNIALYKTLDEDGNIADNYMFCETYKENEDSYIINYYDKNLQKTNTINIIPSSQQILTTKHSSESVKFKASGDWGQDTMDCITHAYSSNGWVSVWAWVQTAFVPATAVAVAGACAGLNAPF